MGDFDFSIYQDQQFACYWLKEGLCPTQSIKSRIKKSGWFLSEGTIHLSKWHPPVCNVENFMKGECYYD
jgi:hypothetical protein